MWMWSCYIAFLQCFVCIYQHIILKSVTYHPFIKKMNVSRCQYFFTVTIFHYGKIDKYQTYVIRQRTVRLVKQTKWMSNENSQLFCCVSDTLCLCCAFSHSAIFIFFDPSVFHSIFLCKQAVDNGEYQ